MESMGVRMNTANFWRNRRVLVTGHEGFLGSNLAKRLLAYGAKVTGIDLKIHRKQTIFTPADYRLIQGFELDIADFSRVKKAMCSARPEFIFHLAAEAIVDRSLDSPLRAFRSNIEGTWNILEVSKGLSCLRALVIASSDKAYGAHERLPYRESDALLAQHPYDASKCCADILAKTYAKSFGLNTTITRCGNIYGPGEFNFSRIVPDAMNCLLSGQTLSIRSDGTFVRDYVYVEDIVSGYLLLARRADTLKLKGESFNLSNDAPLSVLQLLRKIEKISGKSLQYRILNRARCEIKKQYLSSAKARRVLGWKPEFGIDDGLRATLSWYVKNRNLMRRAG